MFSNQRNIFFRTFCLISLIFIGSYWLSSHALASLKDSAPKYQNFFIDLVDNFFGSDYYYREEPGIATYGRRYKRADGVHIEVNVLTPIEGPDRRKFTRVQKLAKRFPIISLYSDEYKGIRYAGRLIVYYQNEVGDFRASYYLPKNRLLSIEQISGNMVEPNFLRFLKILPYQFLLKDQ